jgi:hypothetical protein
MMLSFATIDWKLSETKTRLGCICLLKEKNGGFI